MLELNIALLYIPTYLKEYLTLSTLINVIENIWNELCKNNGIKT
jgi:hypothetical protein